MGKRNFGRIKSLLHFDYPYFNEPNDGLGDEVGYERWTGGANFQLGGYQRPYAVNQSPYFGYRCAYFGGNDPSYQITGTNNTGIFNLSPLGSYEAECFIMLKDTTGGNIFTFGDLVLRISEYHLFIDCDTWNLHEEYNTYGPDYEAELQEGEELDYTKPYIWGVNEWHHVLLRNDKGQISVYLDGLQAISATIHNSKDTIRPDVVKLGAYYGAMDEFVFRRPAEKREQIIPDNPYKGVLDVRKIAGGFGTGADGDVVISADKTINNSYIVTSITSSDEFVVSSTPSALSAGDEVMILLYYGPYQHVGKYVFRNVKSVDTTTKTITLDKEISEDNGEEFTLGDLTCSGTTFTTSKYYIKCIRVPNYNTLTVDSDKKIYPAGGLVVFRCKGDCTLNGKIITIDSSNAHKREDTFQMTHSKLVDRFLTAEGGGIFIACGGTFTASDTARIGATWAGNNSGSSNSGAGAGLGGKGTPYMVDKNGTYHAYGGNGGVGGGGGGGRYNALSASNAEDEGGYYVGNWKKYNSTTVGGAGGGGCGGNGADIPTTGRRYTPAGSGGGGQGGSGGAGGYCNGTSGTGDNIKGNKGGINGGNTAIQYLSNSNKEYFGGAGGGGAGGSGGNGCIEYAYSTTNYGYFSLGNIARGKAGSCLFLITKKLNIASSKVISTGGQAGGIPEQKADIYNSSGTKWSTQGYLYMMSGSGGGGTGFCYIACEEMI